jgi:hypothetical protein
MTTMPPIGFDLLALACLVPAMLLGGLLLMPIPGLNW